MLTECIPLYGTTIVIFFVSAQFDSFTSAVGTTGYQTNESSTHPVGQVTPSPSMLNLDPFPSTAICDNLLDASIRLDNIPLTECINQCQEVSLTECKLINYFDSWKSDTDSRCYIFDELCLMSTNLHEKSINSSHVWYKNQFTKQYCIDYRNYLDNVGDSCQHYTQYGWCNNSAISNKRDIDKFEQLKSEWTAIEACCDCGGGKLVVDGISIAYIDNDNINKDLLECSFKEEQQNMTDIRKWNNFAAFDLLQYINEQSPESYHPELLVFNQIEMNGIGSIIMCDFADYVDDHNINVTNDVFIMMTINHQNISHLLLNSQFFDIDESILPSTMGILYDDYQYCLQQIQDYDKINAQINGVLPCWNQYNHPTLQPTESPVHQINDTDTTAASYSDNKWKLGPIHLLYGSIGGGIILLIIIICAACCIYNKKRKRRKPEIEKPDEMELVIYSEDHFAIHPPKKTDDILPPTTSASYLISSSNLMEDETKPILMFEHEPKERQPGSEGYFDVEMDEKQIKNKKAGNLIVQRQYYDRKQMKYINAKCSKNVRGEYGYMLFGDNDIDRDRANGVVRQHYGGQAGIMGKYDRKMAYGIITSFIKRETPTLDEFKSIMDASFIPLQRHLVSGYDVVYPYPSKQDLRNHRMRYFRNGKQIIHHNIGTGIAFSGLTIEHLEYIQIKLKELQRFASERINVDYYFYNPSKDRTLTIYGPLNEDKLDIIDKKEEKEEKEEKKEDNTIYFCPSCSEQKHYLIKFKNCNHRMCEDCLRGYIIYDMQYDQETDRERFLCYAHAIGKCEASLCIDDIKYSEDRCKCDECKKNNTDCGNGTILDDDNCNKFRNIMLSFDVKLKTWNKDICPNTKCKKPFRVIRPYEMMERYESNASIKEIINENRKQIDHCNCCGQIRLIPLIDAGIGGYGNDGYGNDGDNEEEKLMNNNSDDGNICDVCNYWNCNNCRINCFYEIDTNFTQDPAKPILDAFINYNQQLIKNDRKKNAKFEICEICWHNYYCHICPHCDYTFCGQCDVKWNGNTTNWLNRNNIDNKEEEDPDENYEYSIYDIVGGADSKHIHIKKNHDSSSRHKCIKQKEKLEKQETHKHLIRIDKHREKLSKINLENQQKDAVIIEKEAENFKLMLKIKKMETEITELKIENQQKENIVLSKHLSLTAQKQKEAEEKLEDFKYISIWQWRDDNNKWMSYSKEQMDKIESLKIGQRFGFTINSQNYSIHRLSMDTAQQTNTKTKKSRKVRKIKIKKQIGIQYPDFWQIGYDEIPQIEGDSNNNIIDGKYTTPILMELDINNNEIGKKVANDFYSMVDKKKHEIIKIECVQNRYLWDKYYTQKESMKKSIGLKRLNELNLWHGTHVNIFDKIIKQGFRKEFNHTSRFGEGTYFATNANYSVSNGYCKSNNGIFKIFQCMVLCGESHLGSNNIKLKNWPIKPNGTEQIYDSLVNDINNPSIYVIHDDVRVYPMFIIHFKKI